MGPLNGDPEYAGALVALGTVGLAALSAAYAIAAARRLRRRLDTAESALAAMRRELEFTAGVCHRYGQRLNTLESNVESFGDRVRLVELRGGSRALDEAIDYARRGGDAVRQAEKFGLCGAEAELVTRLHRQARK
jgi:hypothetical protein